jgi:hypothetical protein
VQGLAEGVALLFWTVYEAAKEFLSVVDEQLKDELLSPTFLHLFHTRCLTR